jgi:uncharacterized protein
MIMGNFFFSVYSFFRVRKLLFLIVFLGTSGFFIYLTMNLKTEEKISGTLSSGNGKTSLENVIANFRLTDKIIIHISQSDTLKNADPEALVEVAAFLTDSLLSLHDNTVIRNISPNPKDTVFASLIGAITQNLPLYLNDDDYRRMDSLTRPDVVTSIFRNNYRILNSPAGMVMRERIMKDPLGFWSLGLNKLKMLQQGDRFTMINGYVFTRDLKHLLLFITTTNPVSETSSNGRLISTIQHLINNSETKNSEIRIQYWGGPAMAVGNAIQLKRDVMVTLVIALLLIFLLLAWYFRSLFIPMLGFLPAAYGGLFALSMMFLIKGTISAIALGIGCVLLGLIVDYALYLINRFRAERSIEPVLREMSQTIILCALTSIGAFLCLLFLNSTVLFDLGLFASFSLAGAAIFSLVFLPHFLGERIIHQGITRRPNIVDRIASIRFEKQVPLIVLFCSLGIASLFFLGKVSFETNMNMLNFVDKDLDMAGRELDRINEVSLKSMYIVYPGRDLEEALRVAEKEIPSVAMLERSGTIRNYSGIEGIILSDSLQEARIRRWNDYWTPGKKQQLEKSVSEAAAAIGLRPGSMDGFLASLSKPCSGLTQEQKAYYAQYAFPEYITQKPGMAMVSTIARLQQDERQVVFDHFRNSGDIVVFDRQMITDRFVAGVKSDFDRLVRYTMIFVTLLLVFSLGRIETGLVTAMPMFISWLITLGFMGMTGIRFNIFNIIISSFIFGLGVDYSILMMRGLLYRYKYGIDDLVNTKVAVILSSATTILGVAALFFARHPALNSIALVSVVGVSSVVMITFIFLPLSTDWFLQSRRDKHAFPVTLRILVKTIVTWGNIVFLAITLVIYGNLISPLLPISRKKKQAIFHWFFCRLSKLYIALSFPLHHSVENDHGEDFSKPAIIISNHQSLIETPALLRLHPKILILTNEWVFHNPVFGPVARLSGFIPITGGIEDALELIRKRTDEGYSVLIFPEGHRSQDGHIQRFHKGAFYVAEKLGLDILPVLIFGSGDFLPKGAFFGRPNRLFMKLFPRITANSREFGEGYFERSKRVRRFYIDNYSRFKAYHGNTSYYRRKVLLNFVFKGPVLEWYSRVKLTLEDNYALYHKNLPVSGDILDLGCGYGLMSYMLSYTSGARRVTGVDFDGDKIAVASNGFGKPPNLEFIHADVTNFEFGPVDGIILSDVLHYLPESEQERLLIRCMQNLRDGGVILLREGVKDGRRHKGTKLTEFMSTGIAFNRTSSPSRQLWFLSEEMIRNIARAEGKSVERISGKKNTSNVLFMIK